MLRTRLLWFGLGFSAAAAGVSQLIWRDLWVDRYALASEMHQKFNSLEARVSSLESVPLPESEPAQIFHPWLSRKWTELINYTKKYPFKIENSASNQLPIRLNDELLIPESAAQLLGWVFAQDKSSGS